MFNTSPREVFNTRLVTVQHMDGLIRRSTHLSTIYNTDVSCVAYELLLGAALPVMMAAWLCACVQQLQGQKDALQA